MTTIAAIEATPSHASWVFHSPARPGCAAVAEAIAVIPTAASARAAAIVGRSSLSSSRRLSTEGLGTWGRARLQRRRGLLLFRGKAVCEVNLEHVLRDGSGGGSAVTAVL